MIEWRSAEPDIPELRLSDYLKQFGILDVARLLWLLEDDDVLLVSQGVRKTVLEHVSAHTSEVGGLLVGQVIRGKISNDQVERLIVSIKCAVPSRDFVGTSVSLRMEPEVWTAANSMLGGEGVVVGWYHSHPNLGAFFSGTDRRTQANFFSNHHSFGWVIDPIRRDEKWFRGRDSDAFPLDRILSVITEEAT